MVHTFNPRRWDADHCEGEASLVCVVSYSLARATILMFCFKNKTKHETYFMCMYACLYEYMACVCWCLWRPEEVLDPLELELQVITI